MDYAKIFNLIRQIAEDDIAKAEKFATENNTSVLVIFFDDMKGSAALKNEIGEHAFQKIRKEHDDLLINIITRNGSGRIIKSMGDGLLAVFSKPSTAVERTIEIQERLHGHRYISVRIGMDMGEVRVESAGNVQRDVFGRHVDWAARAMTLADPGHVCVTRSVYDDASHWISKPHIAWKEHGLYRLKSDESSLEFYEPYNPDITQPMSSLRGKKVDGRINMNSDKAKVMVIDDEIGVRESIRMILKDNYDVITSEDPIKAVEYLLSHPVNVVFSDIRMPQMNGIDALKKIKEISPSTDVIMVTAYASFPTAQEALRYEALDYLIKPFSRNDVENAVEKALMRQSQKPNNEHSNRELKDLMEQLRNLIEENRKLNKLSDLKKLESNQKAVELRIVQTISKAVLRNLDLRELLRSVIDQIRNGLGYDNTIFFLLNETEQTLEGVWKNDDLGNIQDASDQKLPLSSVPSRLELANKNGIRDQISCPILVEDNLVGMIQLDNSSSGKKIDDVELDLIRMLAEYVAIAIKNAKQYQNLEDLHVKLSLAYDTTIEGWSRALDMRDKETEGHSQRVTEMTLHIARAMGIKKDEELVQIRRGALLHDIGKMAIPDSILLKSSPLIDEEWEIMKKHPIYAYELLSPIEYLRPALDIPYCHHEKWDGSGYPRGLKGEEIPLAARIFAVADIWDAMRSDRPYRASWHAEKVHEHILSISGSYLDPKVVEVFLKLIGLSF